jgi:hypothetical protein
MSMYRQLWLAIIASMLLALGGGLLASLLSARGYLESQLAIKNTDNATALALALSQSDPDPVSVDLVSASLFDSGHYQLVRVLDPTGNVISERIAPQGEFDAPAWFAALLPIQSAPGQAQISNGWKQFGTVTLISHSRFAYGALWKSACDMTLAIGRRLAGELGVGALAATFRHGDRTSDGYYAATLRHGGGAQGTRAEAAGQRNECNGRSPEVDV